ncbi:MAG: DUF1800 domain-containing protein [Ramlibacter sp.]|nr:DUF1800 domain-containing protein [Ramlibacter sp.]
MNPATDLTATATALNRFGLGARPDEPWPAAPKAWLLGQLDRYVVAPPAWAAQPSAASLIGSYLEQQRALRQADAANELALRQQLARQSREHYRAAVDARVTAALDSPAPLVERLVHFWANHFAVSIDKNPLASLAGAFEAEAIRPHVLGRFEDMLLAVQRHPAMLLYLDQARSIGPDSPAGRRGRPGRQRGLNENLAREILELHTLGVRSGYGQDDVIELARALTGWSLGGLPGLPADGAAGGFAFRAGLHEPGARQLLGQRYNQPGEAQAQAMLHDLAGHPATARHVATKLARHFVGDSPPAALTERLAQTFTRSGGHLPTVYRALIDSPEAWSLAQPKFKTPWEWTLSSLRGLGLREPGAAPLAAMLNQLGQPVWRPGSPAGFDDVAESWMAPDALMRRVELAQQIASRAAGTVDARVLGPQLLPAGLGATTATALARAESPATALALLLASPEFLRR